MSAWSIPKTTHTVRIRPDHELNIYSKHAEEFIKNKSESASRWFYYIFYHDVWSIQYYMYKRFIISVW